MRHYSFKELSFDNYKEATVGVFGGSRPRIVLKHKQNNQQFFLKTYRHNPREIWSEMLASQIGEAAGFNVQLVSLKLVPKGVAKIFMERFGSYLPKDWKPVGALVRHAFPRDHEILYGAQIIGTATEAVSLEQIEKSIRDRYLDSEDILQAIADMIIFDAWIGNMDRHHENWAIGQKNMLSQLTLLKLTKGQREDLKKRRKFTPLFDHGSSLLFELGEDKVVYYHKHRKQFDNTYIKDRQYALLISTDGQKKNIFQILKDHESGKTQWSKRFKKSLENVNSNDDLSIARMIHEMPTDGHLEYSQQRKELLYYSLRRRKELMNEIYES